MKPSDKRLKEIIRRLDLEYPDRTPMLNYRSPFELVNAVALSAQTTDAAVNRCTPKLFEKWPDSAALARADRTDVENTIHSLGFFRQKARNLIAAAAVMQRDFGGEVPRELEQLLTLPGIGRKSAHVVRAHVWGLPGIIVDTHFGRVCRRLGLTSEKDPVKVERELSALIPENQQTGFSMTANFHGRRHCTARKPNCPGCPLEDICPRRLQPPAEKQSLTAILP